MEFLIYNTKSSFWSRVLDESYLPLIESFCIGIQFVEDEFDVPSEDGEMESKSSITTFITVDPNDLGSLVKELQLPVVIDYIGDDPLTGKTDVYTLEIYDGYKS